MRFKRASQGFALPTVVITSVVLFAVLVAAVGMVASTSAALNTQYYEDLAADAAESGSSHANSCLQANGYVSTWGSKHLTPATNCSGNVVSGQKAFVVSTPTYSSAYSVSPVVNSGAGVQTATITGTVSLIRSSGVVWQTYTKTLIVKTAGQIGTSQVVFGYSSGAFFGTVGGDGVMRTVGYNGFGQLGNGTFNSTLTPTKFQTPSTSNIVAGYTNFTSLGYRMFALDSGGTAYAAGNNGGGSLGVGSTNGYFTIPGQVVMSGKQIRDIVPGGSASYFITTDNNVYSAGLCDNGQLGTSYTISGCSNVSVPTRVPLPTPNISSPNTIPTDNLVTDRNSTYVRMAGGAVYGWGLGDLGQLGSNSFGSSSTPVRIGTYGDSGSPAAVQIAFDGVALYILDSNGHVNSIGFNSYGSMGTDTMSLVMPQQSGKCMDNTGANGVSIRLYTCNGTAAQKYQLRSDNTVYNANKNVCLDNKNSDGVTLQLHACNGTAAQKFVWDPLAGSLYNASVNKCVDNEYGDGSTLWLYSCNGSAPQHFSGYNAEPTPFNMAGISGTITKIWTDQWSVSCLTSAGQVWSAGINNSGQFGAGSDALYQPTPLKFNIPVTAVNLYETNNGTPPDYSRQNLYVIGSNGKVYGAGANSYGQLGNGTFTSRVTTPVAMSVIDGASIVASQVQAGGGTAVVFATGGQVYTVGNNNYGQLGNGTTTNSATPIRAKYINNFKSTTF